MSKNRRRTPKNPADQLDRAAQERLIENLAKTFVNESDRGAVLVGAAMLDEALGLLLRAHFTSVSNVTSDDMDFLFERQPLPPLGSLAIKNRIAFCLGLIGSEIRDVINAFRDVRNDFAHTSEIMELEERHIESVWRPFSEQSKTSLSEIVELFRKNIEAAVASDTEEKRPTDVLTRQPSGHSVVLAVIVGYLLGRLHEILAFVLQVNPSFQVKPPATPE
jgi:DNA-binding MltR family transcriptional regulator